MLCEATIDNVLVAQKDDLYAEITYIRDGLSPQADLGKVLDELSNLFPLWYVLGYAYKGEEICHVVRLECDTTKEGQELWTRANEMKEDYARQMVKYREEQVNEKENEYIEKVGLNR